MRGILYLLYALQSLANAYLAGQKKQREIDRAKQEAALRDQKLREIAELHQQRIAQAHNRTALTDIQIEERALELKKRELDLRERELNILKKERALGLTSTPFEPENYE